MHQATQRYNGFFRQLLFILFLLAMGWVIFRQLQFFVGSFLGAITIYVVFRGWMFNLTEKSHWRAWIASLMIVSVTALFLAGFGFAMYKIVANAVSNVDTGQVFEGLNGLVRTISDKTGIDMDSSDLLEKSEGILTKALAAIWNTTYSFTANIVMTLFILYFMLTGGRRMEKKLIEYSPFREESLCMLKKETKNMIFSNAVLMPIILVAQTLVSAVIYWIIGFDNYFFWAFLTALCGLIPLLGTMIVYIPMSIYLIAKGDVLNGIILFAYGATIISNTDNVFRIIFMKKAADTHPLVVIFGVIMGIPLFGFWGIIFGPLLLSGFVLLIRIYYVEYGLTRSDNLDSCSDEYERKVPWHLSFFKRKHTGEKIRQTRDELNR